MDTYFSLPLGEIEDSTKQKSKIKLMSQMSQRDRVGKSIKKVK